MTKKNKGGQKAGDNVVPLFRDKVQSNDRVTSGEISIDGAPPIGVMIFKHAEDAMLYQLAQMIDVQNIAFEEVLKRILGHMAEEANVRDVLKTWQVYKENLDNMMTDFHTMLEEAQNE